MKIIEKLGITPGPWEVSDKIFNVVVSKNATVDEEAKAKGHGEIDYYGGFCIAESILQRNRKIIAAAPEMLDVLIEVMDCAEYWSEYDVPLGMHDRIKSAIEKATGRTWEEIKELM